VEHSKRGGADERHGERNVDDAGSTSLGPSTLTTSNGPWGAERANTTPRLVAGEWRDGSDQPRCSTS